MQLSLEQVAIIQAWAAEHPCILEVFLFGSRARDEAGPDSDIDIAFTLDLRDAEPPLMGRCYGLYVARGHAWRDELIAKLGRHVSLEPLNDDEHWLPDTVRREGVRLWPI